MALSIAKIEAEVPHLYCPFTGRAVDVDGEIKPLRSLLFVYYGDAGMYAYVSKQFMKLARKAGLEGDDEGPEDSPDEVAKQLTLKGAFILEIDTGSNGVNWYGFVMPT